MTYLLTWQQLIGVIIITLFLLTMIVLIPILIACIPTIHYHMSPLRVKYGVQWRSQNSCWCWRLPSILSWERVWRSSWQHLPVSNNNNGDNLIMPQLSPEIPSITFHSCAWHILTGLCDIVMVVLCPIFLKHILPTSRQLQCSISVTQKATPAFKAVWWCIL